MDENGPNWATKAARFCQKVALAAMLALIVLVAYEIWQGGTMENFAPIAGYSPWLVYSAIIVTSAALFLLSYLYFFLTSGSVSKDEIERILHYARAKTELEKAQEEFRKGPEEKKAKPKQETNNAVAQEAKQRSCPACNSQKIFPKKPIDVSKVPPWVARAMLEGSVKKWVCEECGNEFDKYGESITKKQQLPEQSGEKDGFGNDAEELK